MIKKQNKSLWSGIILCGILELIGLIGAYAAHYFTKTRMGMLRHMVYLNDKWEKTVPLTAIKWTAIGFIILLSLNSYRLYQKRIKPSKLSTAVMVLTFIVNMGSLAYLILQSDEVNRAYYIIGSCLILVSVVQNILHCYFFSKNP